jgi:hypothetical protein
MRSWFALYNTDKKARPIRIASSAAYSPAFRADNHTRYSMRGVTLRRLTTQAWRFSDIFKRDNVVAFGNRNPATFSSFGSLWGNWPLLNTVSSIIPNFERSSHS